MEDKGKDTVKALEQEKIFLQKNLIIINIDYQSVVPKVKNIFILKYNKADAIPVYISTFLNSKSEKIAFNHNHIFRCFEKGYKAYDLKINIVFNVKPFFHTKYEHN